MLVEIVKAEQAHALFVAEHMRMADKSEVWARCRKTPLQAAMDSLATARICWAGLVDGEPVCLFGVGEMETGVGLVGLLGTDRIARLGPVFLRRCKPYVAEMLNLFPRLTNFVHAENAISIRWLEWLGFEIDKRPMLFNDEPFYLFWKVKHV